jgi:hypothetical protein
MQALAFWSGLVRIGDAPHRFENERFGFLNGTL